jgi:hypothetical protein
VSRSLTCTGLLGCVLSSCTEPIPAVRIVSAELDTRIPTVAHLSWSSLEGEEARVQILDGSGDWIPTDDWQSPEGAEHIIHIGALPPGSVIQARAQVRTRDGSVGSIETVSFQTQPLPIGFPDITVQTTEDAPDGLVLTHLLSTEESIVMIVDRTGQPVWYTIPESDERILSVDLAADGESLWFAQHPTNYVDVEGTAHHVALNGSFYEEHRVDRIHSGVVELPEGGFGYIYKADDDWDGGTLLWDEIWERDAQGVDREVFSLRDHFEPERLCSHWELTDLNDEPTSGYFDWSHANSLILSEDGSAWYLLVRHFDALLKIDRASGELIWSLGGPYSDFEPVGEGAFVSHPHLSQLQDGRIIFFDNGDHYSPPGSRVAVIRYDEDAMTMELESEIRAPGGHYVSELGDAIELSNGGIMASWSSLGLIEEYSPIAETLWSLSLELGYYTGRISWLDSL